MAEVASATSGTKPKKHEDHLVDVWLAWLVMSPKSVSLSTYILIHGTFDIPGCVKSFKISPAVQPVAMYISIMIANTLLYF